MMRKLPSAAVLVALAMCAHAAVKNETIRITVLDSESRAVSTDNSGVPKNCDPLNYDAYCHSSKTAEVVNTLLVQEEDNPPFRVSCTIDSKWSRCVPLLKGYSFEAKRENRGLVVYYVDDNGKPRKQLYTYVPEAKGSTPQPVAAGAARTNTTPMEAAGQASTAVPPALSTREMVKCSFTSTPPGAEISLDGRYIGSTPSELSVSTGNHVVVVSMPGFAQWNRELTVSPGSELTVNAVLEKAR